MPHTIRKLIQQLDELQLGNNILNSKIIDDDEYHTVYEFDTTTNHYTVILKQCPYDEDAVIDNPWDTPDETILEIEFTTRNLKTGVHGDPVTAQNTNKGDPELIRVYSTIADLVMDFVYENYDHIKQIQCHADPKKARIYSNLIKSNLASMLPDFKMVGPLTLEKIDDE